MNDRSFTGFLTSLGPGILFAAQAVGISHLVQSTRAGGEFGLSLIPLIIATCIVKYPSFRFGIDYVNATGKPLLDSYFRQGKFALTLFWLGLLVDMFIATAAVTLVTAGLLASVLQINTNIQVLSIGLLISFSLLIMIGKYRLFELITKTMVLLFFVLTLFSTLLVIIKIPGLDQDFLPPVSLNDKTILFLIAVAGWMPTSVTASIYLSEWSAEKRRLPDNMKGSTSALDFDIGYWGTAFLAVCFVLLGAVLIYPVGMTAQPSATGFAQILFNMFSAALGNWAFPVIAVTATAVMISTCLSLADACPRAANSFCKTLLQQNLFVPLAVIQVTGASIVLLYFMTSFTALIDLATSLAFLSAPFVAYLNHRAVFSADIEASEQPRSILKKWSCLGIIALTVFAIIYVYIRFLK